MAKGKGLKSQLKGLRKRISSLFQHDHHQNQGRDAEEQSCPASLCKEKKIPLRWRPRSYLRTETCCPPSTGVGTLTRGWWAVLLVILSKATRLGSKLVLINPSFRDCRALKPQLSTKMSYNSFMKHLTPAAAFQRAWSHQHQPAKPGGNKSGTNHCSLSWQKCKQDLSNSTAIKESKCFKPVLPTFQTWH